MPADTHSPEKARRIIADWAGKERLSDLVTETAQLLVSELVTNSHRAYANVDGPCGPVAVIIQIEQNELVIVVADQAPGIPMLRPSTGNCESGRGLALVNALSHRWSWSGQTCRKFVWFALLLDMDEPSPDLSMWSEEAA